MPTPLQSFFDGFAPQFQYDSQAPATTEFQRLAQVEGWTPNQQALREARREFKDALVDQFNANYGIDENSLTGWQALCEVLGVEPIPDTLKEARRIVKSTHVNLVDLADARGRATKVKIFKTVALLRKYTVKNGKIFPKKSAKAGGLLKHLLRPILTQ